jgi:hypothetical protein
MKRYVLLALIIVFPIIATQLKFVEAIGGLNWDEARGIIQTYDNGYALAGWTNSYGAGNTDMILSKFDKWGSHIWTRIFGGTGYEEGGPLVQTSDSGIVVVGHTNTFGAGNYDILVTKFSAAGNFLWSKTIGGSNEEHAWQFRHIIETIDKGLAIACMSNSYGLSARDLFIVRLDSIGNFLWATTLGWYFGPSPANEHAYAIIQTSDKGFATTGSSWSFGSNDCAIILSKLDSLGNHLWSRMWGARAGPPDGDVSSDLIETPDNNIVVVGETDRFTSGGSRDLLLTKFDNSGTHLWTRTWGGSGLDCGYSLVLTPDNGFVVTGYTQSFGAGSDDIILSKFNSDGTHLWSKVMGDLNSDKANSIALAYDNGFAFAGLTKSFGVDSVDMILAKSDSTGTTGISNPITPVVGSPSPTIHSDVPTVTHPTPIVQNQTPNVISVTPDVHLIYHDDSIPPIPFDLISPPDSTYIATTRPNFDWSASFDSVTGINRYEVYINDTLRHCCCDTTWTCSYDLNDGYNNWYIVAYDNIGLSRQSNQIWTLYVDTLAPLAPNLINPVGGIYFTDSLVQFEWTPVTFGKILMSQIRNEEIDILAAPVKYLFQLDTINDFTYPVIADTFDTTTASQNLTENHYYWRVKAFDLAGNQSPYSNSDSFSIDLYPPSIDSTTIWHDTSFVGPFTIYSLVKDLSEVDTVILYYKRMEDPAWFWTGMIAGSHNWFYAEIPRVNQINDTVKYYIYTKDIFEHATTDPIGAPENFYHFIANLTGIQEGTIIPKHFSFSLKGNPVIDKVVFKITLPNDALISLRIYDATGRLVDSPITGRKSAGIYEIAWKANARPGVYFYALESPWINRMGKLVILR